MLITLHAPKLGKGITIRLSEKTVKALQARMAIGISLHMFPLETRRVKAKRSWKAPEVLEKYHLVYFNNQWHLKDKVSSNNTALNTGKRIHSKLLGINPNVIIGDEN